MSVRQQQSGYAYSSAIYLLTWIVMSFLWGVLNATHGDLVTQTSSILSHPEAQRGLGWMDLAWSYFPFWVALVLLIFLLAKAAYTSRRV
jgi:nitrogen fixation-related uncharacterized protein